MHVPLCFFGLFKFTSVYIARLTARLTPRTRYTCTRSFAFRLLEFTSASIACLTPRTRYTYACRFVFRLLTFEYASPLIV